MTDPGDSALPADCHAHYLRGGPTGEFPVVAGLPADREN